MPAKISDKRLLDELARLSAELGKTPRAKDMRKVGKYSVVTYSNRFGSWNEALDEAGLCPNQSSCDQSKIDKDRLRSDLHRVADLVDRTPRGIDVTQHGEFAASTFRRHLTESPGVGSWSDVLENNGYEPTEKMGVVAERECENCSDSIELRRHETDRRFCSPSCFYKWRSENLTGEDHHLWTPRVSVVCSQCGSTLQRPKHRLNRASQRMFCDTSCKGEWMSENLVGENHPNYTGYSGYGEGWSEKKKERVRQLYGRQCQGCGLDEEEHLGRFGDRLCVHHIVPAHKFDSADKRNAIDNLVPLCRDCHKKWEGVMLKPVLVNHAT